MQEIRDNILHGDKKQYSDFVPLEENSTDDGLDGILSGLRVLWWFPTENYIEIGFHNEPEGIYPVVRIYPDHIEIAGWEDEE